MKRLLVLTLCFFVLGANTGKDPKFDTMILKDQGVSSISNAPSSSIRQIVRSGALYLQDSSGVETQVGSGSGGINYVSSNPGAESATTGWSTYDDGAASTPTDCTGGTVTSTYARNTTTPLRGNGDFKFTRSSGTYQGEGAFYSFTIPKADYSKALSISFDYDTDEDTAYTAGDLKVYLIRDTGGTPTLVTPSFTSIPYGAGKFQATFVSTTDDDWRLCFHQSDNTSEAWDVYIDNVVVGPSEIVQSAPVSGFLASSSGMTWNNVTQGSGATNQLYYRRVGGAVEIWGILVLGTGGDVTGSISATMPSAIGTSCFTCIATGTKTPVVGTAWFMDEAGASDPNYSGNVQLNSANNLTFQTETEADGGANATQPFNWDASDEIHFKAVVPISEWSGSATGLTNSRVEYACNSSTTDAADTASFSYGPSGCQFGAFTAPRNKRVQFQTAIQPTDKIEIQTSSDSGATWIPVGQGTLVESGHTENTGNYGMVWAQISTTQIDVSFYTYRTSNGATFGAAGAAWSDIDIDATYKYRVVKSANPLAVGFDSSNIVGVQTATDASAGYVGEYLRDYDAGVSLGTGGYTCTSQISLTPGDWDVSGATYCPATASATSCYGGIDSSSSGANLGSSVNFGEGAAAGYVNGATSSGGFSIPPIRVNITASATYYLCARATGATVSGNTSIRARRVR